jgi:hypothetical protein
MNTDLSEPVGVQPPVVAVELPPNSTSDSTADQGGITLPTPPTILQETSSTLPNPRVELEIESPVVQPVPEASNLKKDLPVPSGLDVPSLPETACGNMAVPPPTTIEPHGLQLASNPPTPANPKPVPDNPMNPAPAEPTLEVPVLPSPDPTASTTTPPPNILPGAVIPDVTLPPTPASETLPADITSQVDGAKKPAELPLPDKNLPVTLTGVGATDPMPTDIRSTTSTEANEFKFDPPLPSALTSPSPPGTNDDFKAPGTMPIPPTPAATAQPPAPTSLPMVEPLPAASPSPSMLSPTLDTSATPPLKQPDETRETQPTRSPSSVEPITSFDVDLHEVRQGDSYRGISQKYLGDDRYAEAIRAFNGNRSIEQFQRSQEKVRVPPIHILRKSYPNLIGQPESGNRSTDRAVEWMAPVGFRGRATAADRGLKTYIVPPGGITPRGVAKEAFGDELEWRKVWDENPKYSPDELIPAGTRLLLPPDAKVGR